MNYWTWGNRLYAFDVWQACGEPGEEFVFPGCTQDATSQVRFVTTSDDVAEVARRFAPSSN